MVIWADCTVLYFILLGTNTRGRFHFMTQNLIGLFNGLILLQLTKILAPTQPFSGVRGGMMTNA